MVLKQSLFSNFKSFTSSSDLDLLLSFPRMSALIMALILKNKCETLD